MTRFIHLILFKIKSFWRKTYLLTQFILLALTCSLFLDPRYAPYSYENIVILRNIYLIIIASITSFQLVNRNYARSLHIFLSRVNRNYFYGASILANFIISQILILAFDLYVLVFARLPLSRYLTKELLICGLLNAISVILLYHLFSPYVMDRKYQLPGFLLVLISAIPDWFQGLPTETLLKFLSYLLPPLGQNILIQLNGFTWATLWAPILSLFYIGLLLFLGLRGFNRKSLTNL